MAKAAKEEPKTAKATVTKKINSKGFDLTKYKKTKNLDATAKFKKQEWIQLSPAFQETVSVPGIPVGFISLFRGHSDTGKTTAMIEAAISTQKSGRLPVFIITEMKWSWEHAIEMGFDAQRIVDTETGEINYTGDFIYVDLDSLNTVEDVALFMNDLMDEQIKGLLPFDLVFLWDSAGSIPCEQSRASGKNNNMWNAGAMATQFGNFVNQRITLSRKEKSQYTNTFIVVNKIRVEYPTLNIPGAQPKMKNKAGDTMYWDAGYIFTFGNVTGPGTTKLKATKNGKQIEWAKIVKLTCDKNHIISGISTTGRIIVTPHGFITEKDKEKYKKSHAQEWAQILGSTDFDIVEEEDDTTVDQESSTD